MNILDSVTQDLNWRETEIASMRIMLNSPGITESQKRTLLRAAWALLYAHYEGFCKNTLMLFYDFIENCGIPCRNLPLPTKILSLGDSLNKMRKMNDLDLLNEINNFEGSRLAVAPQFPAVDTNSNLWPTVLVELLAAADLNSSKVLEHELQLKTLVARRNKIAHGEYNFIEEFTYYNTYENAVYDVMYDIAIQVDDRLNAPPFNTALPTQEIKHTHLT
jgi:hypothetical protein